MGRSDPGKGAVPLGGNRESKGLQLRNGTELGREQVDCQLGFCGS